MAPANAAGKLSTNMEVKRMLWKFGEDEDDDESFDEE